jgi:hypothetical protein
MTACCAGGPASDQPDPIGSCELIESAGLCLEYSVTSTQATHTRVAVDTCGVMGGAWRDGSCPADDREGLCTMEDGSRVIFYPPFHIQQPERGMTEYCHASGGELTR